MLKTLAPRVAETGKFVEAHQAALSAQEPVFVPATLFADDRGWSLMNQFQGILTPQGQINFSMMYPGVIKAWHRHRQQTDFWICAAGHLKVGIHRDPDAQSWLMIIGEKRPGALIIPPTLWHGAATVGPDPAGLLYYVSHAFNPQAPDEDRRAYDSIPGFPWGVRHG